MPSPGFYNINTGRSYPLVPFSNVELNHSAPLVPPLDLLVDFGCLVGLDAEFDSDKNFVYLHEIRRTGDDFEFDFLSDAPGLVGYVLTFRRNLFDVEYATEHVQATPVPDSSDSLWEGFLVTGSLETLADLMPLDGVMAIVDPHVEPTLIQNLGQSYLRTINLANQDRIRVTPSPDCQGGEIPVDEPRYIVYTRNLDGDLRFKEGYNIAIRQNNRDNSLTFLASQGAGAGVPCEEVKRYPNEEKPDGSILFTGGPACNEVVNSINGLTSSVINLVADLGVSIYPSQTKANTLTVDIDRHDMTVCGPIETVVEPPPDGGDDGDVGGGKPPPDSSNACTPLPYFTDFLAGFPPAWYVALGNFSIEDNATPGEAAKSLASTNLDQHNIAVWNCYRTENTEMTATTRLKLMPGTQANGGLVWPYYAKVPDLGLKNPPCLGHEGYIIWLVNAVTNSLEQWSRCMGGSGAVLQLEVRWPAGAGVNQIVVGDLYQITARIGKRKTYYPTENPWKFDGVLTGITKPAFAAVKFGFNYADVPTILPPNFQYTTGVWGVGSFNAHCRFNQFKVERTPMVLTS